MNVKRTNIILKPDISRVLLRPFFPGTDERAKKVISRILSLPNSQIKSELRHVLDSFENRHNNLKEKFIQRSEEILKQLSVFENLSNDKKLLIGAYFCHEYSIEAAALFNPSIVKYPVNSHQNKFLISLRATGEGHISSVTFRTGKISETGQIEIDKPSKIVNSPDYSFSENLEGGEYDFSFEQKSELSSNVIFPFSSDESNGIEDARFVQFQNDDKTKTYYSTYTAYDGKTIRIKLLQTDDFNNFKIRLLYGTEVQNKGMALFPRKMGNQFVMLSRQDNENNYIMFSNDLFTWDEKTILTEPIYPLEFVQLGNCGSPIETKDGWLVISHAVGPMRKYTLGAYLLDLNEPQKVIGRLKDPLLSPDESEREGYVPNVVYSCGSAVFDNKLIIPYAMSDYSSTFATVDLDEILEAMK